MIIPFIIWFCIFLFLIIMISIIYRKLGKKNLAIIVSSTHLLIVGIIALIVFINLDEAQIEFMWFILMLFNFPIMIIYNPITKFILNIIGDNKIASSLLAPSFFFGIFGTFQYYLIGRIVDYLIKKYVASTKPKKDQENSIVP